MIDLPSQGEVRTSTVFFVRIGTLRVALLRCAGRFVREDNLKEG
jgi:hypothetical protein